MSTALSPPSRQILCGLQCRRTLLRHATTSTSTPSTLSIPPESPEFVNIPRAPQAQARRKPKVKGVLPVPRDIFPPKSKDKTSPEYLAAVTPEPKSTVKFVPVGSPEVKDLAEWTAATNRRNLAPVRSLDAQDLFEWKARQAAIRRRNLREGLVALYKRKQSIDRQVAARTAFRQAEHERKIRAPEREDDLYTNSSIVFNLKLGKIGGLSDPQREERVSRGKARFEEKELAKREDRRYTLHTLYMNARTFIVDEAALDVHLNEVFDDDFYKQYPDRSIWDREKLPDTVRTLLLAENRGGTKAVASNTGYAQITSQRVKRIAEELTGGKM